VTIAALKTLADEGSVAPATVAKAIKKYGIDPDKPNPATV
jgi:pyruvate dehydrogenase E1 component